MQTVRRLLDLLYTVSGVAAALCMIAILSLIVVQMLARWTGEVFPGAPDYAGYAMASASFLAFASALNKGSHIRVSIVVNALGTRARRALNIWCFGIGALIAWYFAYYAYRFVAFSYQFNDISQGQDRTALWIPQSVMLFGAVVLAIALTDHLVSLIFRGDHRIEDASIDQSFGE